MFRILVFLVESMLLTVYCLNPESVYLDVISSIFQPVKNLFLTIIAGFFMKIQVIVEKMEKTE